MALKKGDKAPNFKLFNQNKKEISLSDFKGKNLILHFFPLAFTSTCTAQLCTVRDSISLYHNDKCDVVGVSVDSLFTLGKFKQEQKLNFDLLSDFNKTVSTAYDSLIETFGFNMHGVSKRSVFVIDGNGVIQYAEIMDVTNELPNFKAIDEAIAIL